MSLRRFSLLTLGLPDRSLRYSLVLELDNLTKRYGALSALDGVSASFVPGEVHAVLGENGAGKSTLVSLIAGFVVPDSGQIRLNGQPVPLGNPQASKRLGIEMIHQHFTLVPAFTVRENLALARMPGLWGPLRLRSRAQGALDVAKRLNWEIDPDARVRDLPVGVQQRVEILKALGGNAQVVIFDEPTAVLTQEEAAELIGTLRQLRDEGKIVVLIAHKLSEVMAAADRVTVLRRGQWVASAPRGEFTSEQLATWMVGEMPEILRPGEPTRNEERLEATDIRVRGDRGEEPVSGVNFEVRRGEVLGIGGVDGNGQVELAEALAGIRKLASGRFTFEGLPINPLDVAYIPQDRQGDGLALNMSILENLMVTGYRDRGLVRSPFLPLRKLRAWASGLIEQYGVKASGPGERIGALSGGNQQKVVVSRALYRQPKVLIAASPTRGLDFRAAEFVRERILSAREQGTAVVLFSTDLEELTELSDRVLFMSRGQLVQETGVTALVGGSDV